MRIALDWDGTVVENVWPLQGDWLPGAESALKQLVSDGHKVVIHSARISPYEVDGVTRRSDATVRNERRYIKGMLRKAGLYPAVKLHTRSGKPGADLYVDDKALRFEGDWEVTMKKLKRYDLIEAHGHVHKELLPDSEYIRRLEEEIVRLNQQLEDVKQPMKRVRVDI